MFIFYVLTVIIYDLRSHEMSPSCHISENCIRLMDNLSLFGALFADAFYAT